MSDKRFKVWQVNPTQYTIRDTEEGTNLIFSKSTDKLINLTYLLNNLNNQVEYYKHLLEDKGIYDDLKELEQAYWNLSYEHRDFCDAFDELFNKYERRVKKNG